MRILLFCFLYLSTFFTPATQANDVVFRIRDETVHRINPRLFGQFMERPSWGEIGPEGALVPGTHRLQPDVIKLIRQMRIPILRFPGGTDVDFMDWRDMVGNVPGRGAERPVSTGHRGHKVTNHFGYDEFLRLQADLNSEAIIVVNFRDALLGKKPLRDAALHAAGLVAYCNGTVSAKRPEGMPNWPSIRARNGHSKPYNVKYWQIGNETWAFFDELKKLAPQNPERHYAECLVAVAQAMLSVDPNIEFIVDGDGLALEAVKLAKKELGERIKYLVFHVYTPWAIGEVKKDGKPFPVEKLSDADIWKAWVATPGFNEEGLAILRHPLLAEARKADLKLAVTEWNWNGWWRTDPRPLSSAFAKGVGAAGFVHALMRSADVVEIGCQSMLVGNSWGIHAIHADRQGKTPPYYMPSGQVTALYSQHHGSRLLAMDATGVPSYSQPFKMGGIGPKKKVASLDALATANEETVFFHAINRQFEQPIEITIDVSAMGALTGKGNHYLLQGRLNDRPSQGEPVQIGSISYSEISYQGNTLRILLPARTVSCIEFPRKQ